jgi:hypothetical protein
LQKAILFFPLAEGLNIFISCRWPQCLPIAEGLHVNLLLFFKIYILSISGQYHRENDNMDYFYQLEIWKGNISGALRIAREREELSDWLVAMAPMGMQQIA